MKKFAGVKPFNQLVIDAKTQGYTLNTKPFDEGSDWLYLRKDQKLIAVNMFNGVFFVYADNKCIATEISTELEKEAWYSELLELLYRPLPALEQKRKSRRCIDNTND